MLISSTLPSHTQTTLALPPPSSAQHHLPLRSTRSPLFFCLKGFPSSAASSAAASTFLSTAAAPPTHASSIHVSAAPSGAAILTFVYLRPINVPLTAPVLPIYLIQYTSSTPVQQITPFPDTSLVFTITSNATVPQINLHLPQTPLFSQSVSTTFRKQVPRPLTKIQDVSVHAEKVCVCMRARACVCVCVRERERLASVLDSSYARHY